MREPSGVLLPVAIRILRKPHPGFGAIVSRNLAELAVLFDPRGSFGHRSLRPESMTSTQRTRGEVVSPTGQ